MASDYPGRPIAGSTVHDKKFVGHLERLKLPAQRRKDVVEIGRLIQGRDDYGELILRHPIGRRWRDEGGDPLHDRIGAVTRRAKELRLAVRRKVPPAGRAGQARNGLHAL